jgi:hypothetical protein
MIDYIATMAAGAAGVLYQADKPQCGFFVRRAGSGELKEVTLKNGVSKVVELGTVVEHSPITGRGATFVKLKVMAGANFDKVLFFPKTLWDAQLRMSRWYQPYVN